MCWEAAKAGPLAPQELLKGVGAALRTQEVHGVLALLMEEVVEQALGWEVPGVEERSVGKAAVRQICDWMNLPCRRQVSLEAWAVEEARPLVPASAEEPCEHTFPRRGAVAGRRSADEAERVVPWAPQPWQHLVSELAELVVQLLFAAEAALVGCLMIPEVPGVEAEGRVSCSIGRLMGVAVAADEHGLADGLAGFPCARIVAPA